MGWSLNQLVRRLIAGQLLLFPLLSPARGSAQYQPSYLNVSLSELQASLRTVDSAVTFAPRPGSAHGTQEARLPENSGVVQAAGSPGNLSVIVLWLPVGTNGQFVNAKSRPYLAALLRVFTEEGDAVVRWVERVLGHAMEDGGKTSHLESQLFDHRQLKALYVPTLSPPMLSLTVEAGGQGSPQ